MGEYTAIEWAHHTFNPWMGCTKVSDACRFCYAERDMDHRFGKVAWGPNGTRVVTSAANWRKPLKWDRAAEEAGERPRVFCASLADVFEDWRGLIYDSNGNRLAARGLQRHLHMEDLRADLFRLIDATPHLDWLLLTKRPERILECWPERCGTDCECECHEVPPPNRHIPCQAGGCWERPNTWLGTTVENCGQLHRIDELRKCRGLAPVLFLSCEPLLADLGPIDLTGIDWVIAGGESGPHARPSHPMWFRSLRDQCVQAGVPFFFKQWGEWGPPPEGIGPMVCVGKKAAGRMLDGREWGQFPEVVA